jgi:glycosyltransferase involved in cell wall biosynthesis
MASGCLVAASRAGSIPEVLGDNGILFDPREAAEIEAAMERVLELGDEERDRITEAARERARMFQPERLIQQTLGVYAQALAGRGSGVADERGGPGSPSRSAA